MGEDRKVYRVLMGKPKGKRPRHRWEERMRMYVGEIGWGGVDLIGLG
jgi:hypothetical protein